MRTRAEQIAELVVAIQNCISSGNTLWQEKHGDRLQQIVHNHLPHGGGFDVGTAVSIDASTGNKLTFVTSFHHMNDVGMYDEWTEHTVVVKPSFAYGLNIRVTGKNRNDIKDYIDECFRFALLSRTGD